MKRKISLKSKKLTVIADVITPVSIYLRLRDQFPNSVLLESSDYHSRENSFSYICCNPIAGIKYSKGQLETLIRGEENGIESVSIKDVQSRIQDFAKSFECEVDKQDYISTGIFGYLNYDMVQGFEDIDFQERFDDEIPMCQYHVFQNILVFDHLKNQLHIFSLVENEEDHNVDFVRRLISAPVVPNFSFNRVGEKTSNVTDAEFREMVKMGKEHCQRGDVFQIVMSRRFEQKFKGDDFNVYRALRSVNPSPYLFHFDYGDYKLMGSSPEAQIIVNNNVAEIHPIAGTFRRSGNDLEDAKLAEKLSKDPKENAEHTMLVDLARNDLSRHCEDVNVEVYREVQFYSHVIHLVSKVKGALKEGENAMDVVAGTFPAGNFIWSSQG